MILSIKILPYRRQWLAVLSLSLGALVCGNTKGWSSPYIAKLTAPNCTHRFKLTSAEASWVASLPSLGGLLGATLSAVLQDIIGRKKTLLLLSGPLAAGLTIIIVAPNVLWLYTSRVLTGISGGVMYSASASFLGEIADPMIRGSLILFNENAISLGILLGNVMGGLLPMETFSFIGLAVIGLFFVTFAFVPESPYYHITNGDIGKAEKSLKWYKEDVDIKQETCKLQKFIGSMRVGLMKRLNEFKKPEHRKSLLIILSISTFLYCAGTIAMHSYAEIILTTSKVDLTPSVVVMVLSFSAIVAGTVALVLVDRIGRRALLIGSGISVFIGYMLLGFHFYMLSSGVDPKSISWLPVLSLFVVYFSMPCGLSSVNEALLGELFPPTLKTLVAFIKTIYGALLSFVTSKYFQPYVDFAGEQYVFWTFATSALCSAVFAYFCIPETTRISLIDIQTNLKQDRNRVSDIDIETNTRTN